MNEVMLAVAAALAQAQGPAATPRTECDVAPSAIATKLDATSCQRLLAQLDLTRTPARPRCPPIDRLRVTIAVAPGAVLTARMTAARGGHALAVPSAAVAISDRRVRTGDIDMLAHEVNRTLSIIC